MIAKKDQPNSDFVDDNARIFPQKLMEMLSDPESQDAISWVPSGKAFVILNRQKLINEVLPKYFRKTKFTSFTRKLNRWNFARVTRGPDLGAYYHQFFQRGDEYLCTQMYCNNERAKFATSQPQEIRSEETSSASNTEAQTPPESPPSSPTWRPTTMPLAPKKQLSEKSVPSDASAVSSESSVPSLLSFKLAPPVYYPTLPVAGSTFFMAGKQQSRDLAMQALISKTVDAFQQKSEEKSRPSPSSSREQFSAQHPYNQKALESLYNNYRATAA